ncbi:MAG: MlaD family protein [Robiginitalea sp.]|uniref:MlaD family protein n=1 Tax=Robiginitalea sp. TaxID=1902411 RepID=UPI003C711A25
MRFSRELKTGIIVIGGILLFIMGFSYLKSTPIFDNSKVFYAVYDHVGGLQAGTQVTINGFSVGKVNDIKFKDSSGSLMVTFTVSNDFNFSKNSVAELYDTGIIGGKGIQIIPVFDQGAAAQSGDTLPTRIRPGITELVQQKLTPLQNKVEDAVSNADSVLINFNRVLDADTQQNLRESVQGLNQLISSLQGTTNNLNTFLKNNQGQLDSAIGNIHDITVNFSKISDSLSNAGLSQTVRPLEATLANLDLLLQRMEQGEGTMGKLLKDEELYENLANASRELDLLLQDFRLNPKRYVNVSVFGKKQKEYEVPENDPAIEKDPN